MKKIFTVHRNCYATLDIEVAAETEEQAIEIARRRFDEIEAKEYDFCENAVEVIDTNDMPNVDDMVEAAVESIRQEVENDGDAIGFDAVEVSVTVLEPVNYREAGYVEHKRYMDAAYVSEDGDIWVQPEECEYEDMELLELSEPDQIKVLTAILER